MYLPDAHYSNRRLEKMVENQTSYALKNAEMHIFETHQQAERVLLRFDQPVLASMLEGKKVMHLQETNSFGFLPGESLMLPASELMCIDFPEASVDQPTRCLAMGIDEDLIRDTVNMLNENKPKVDGTWAFNEGNYHFTNDVAIQQILQRLLFLFTENHASKDVFADFMIRELIMRILQNENRQIYTDDTMKLSSSHRLAYVVQHIRKNLDQDLSIGGLSKLACMSESNFHRVFKNELNVSPVDFINNERLKLAASLLKNPRKKIKEVYTQCGFNSMSYFIRMFKRKEKVSPKQYQQLIVRE